MVSGHRRRILTAFQQPQTCIIAFSLGGVVTPKGDIRFNPLLTANTFPPFDITVSRDLYGDTLFNGRPGIATDPTKPAVVDTKYGLLDPNSTRGESGRLPRAPHI